MCLCSLVLAARRVEMLESIAEECRLINPTVSCIPTDATDEASVKYVSSQTSGCQSHTIS